MKHIFCEEYCGCIISASVYGKDLQYSVIDDLSRKSIAAGSLNARETNIVFLKSKLKYIAETKNSCIEIKEIEMYR